MGSITLVVGGARSGKSAIAEDIAESIGQKRTYIATCPRLEGDSEINSRIDKHIAQRAGKGWQTIEEQIEIERVIATATDADVILIDCLTLWINNLLFESGNTTTEREIIKKCEEIIRVCGNIDATCVFVSGEVGCGIIPENKVTRLYRDLVGRCNQVLGKYAHQVILVSCGIAHTIK